MSDDDDVATVGTPRDAIVFIPGIGGPESLFDQSTEGIANRIRVAIDRNAKTGSARFHVEVETENYGDGRRTDVCTIYRRSRGSDQPVPVLDVYGFDYHEALVGDFERRSSAGQSMSLLTAIISSSVRMLAALVVPGRGGKGLVDRLQFLYGGFILMVMSAYFVVLLAATLDLALRLIDVDAAPAEAQKTTADAAIGFLASHAWFTALIAFATGVVVFVSSARLVVPRAAQDTIEVMSRNYFCLSEYLDVGSQRPTIVGGLEALLEHLAEKDVPPRQIHIVAYSFGSIVALDAMLPRGEATSTRIASVASLVTIGCPFDLIRTFWPKYFTERRMAIALPALQRWFNVYSNADVLGSNFRNDDENDVATQSVGLDRQSYEGPPLVPKNVPYGNRTVSIMGLMGLAGLRAHSLYWERTYRGESSCFHAIVAELFRDDELLA